jgi:hypothetical protein
MNSVQKRPRLSTRVAIILIASALMAIPAGPAASETPIRQYVCRIDSGPLSGQITLVTASTSPGVNNACNTDGRATVIVNGELSSATGEPLVNTGQVVFEHTAQLRQYLCDPGSGPLMLLSQATPPGLGEPCDDGAGGGGVVVFVEAPG